jgi:hypothetical protein
MAHPSYGPTEARYDLRLTELGLFLATYTPLEDAAPAKLATPVAQKLSRQLDRDVAHLRTLADLPTTMAFMATLFEQSWQQAFETWLHDGLQDPPAADPATPALEAIPSNPHSLTNAIQLKALQILRGKLADTKPPKNIALEDPPAVAVREVARGYIDMFMELSQSGHQCGLQFLATLCVRTWTVFEVLTGDLWEEALNSNPESLGKTATEYRSRDAEDPDNVISGDRRNKSEPEKKDRAIHVPLNKLVECNWNLSNRLGTYCRDKFSFQKVEKIKDAYESVWPKSFDAKINAIFDQDLKEAAAIRNAIVHSGGHPDEKFKWQVGRKSQLCALPDNQHIPLNGKWVNHLASVVTTKAQELILLVDESLQSPSNT